MIQLDSVALQDLVDDRGRARGGSGAPLSDRTTTTALEIEAFQTNSPPRSASLHAAWTDAVAQAFLAERPGVETFAWRLIRGAGSPRGLRAGPGGPNLLRSLGLDGRARLRRQGTFPVAGTWSTRGNAHVGAFVNVTLRQSIRVREDGSARVSAVVLFEMGRRHRAAVGPAGRPAGGLPIGTYAAGVTLYLPGNARNLVAETSRPSPIEVGRTWG